MNQLDVNPDGRLSELILQWEESLSAGVRQSPAEICRDCPEMTSKLEFALSRLQTLDQFMFSGRSPGPERVLPDDSPPQDLPHFPTIPGYEVLAEIGHGGMGVVYKGRQKSLNRVVAIKTLHGVRWRQSGYIDRLRQEAKGLALIVHPNVVKIIDVVETPSTIAIILEYVEGENLASRLGKSAIAPVAAARLVLELAQTMAFVHERGLWHRDIKPANILISPNGSIKVADFGLVKEEGGSSSLTGTGDYFGTPSYMAPEQIPGSIQPVDARTDVYGLGATLYEMLCGRPPFVGVSPLATLEQVQNREPVALRILNPGVPRDLETICLKCLEKEPTRRFASALNLADELARFVDGIPIHSRPIGLLERCWRWSRRQPAIASLVLLSFATSVAIMALIVINIRSREEYIRELDNSASRAKDLQQIAEKHESQAKDALYVADMNRAGTALRQNDTRELVRLLQEQIPAPGKPDRRGFEWWHLYRRVRLARQTLLDIGSAQYLLGRAPQQESMFAAGADSILRFFHSDTGELVRQIPTGQIEINGVAFSPDGKEFATAGDDGTIIIWDLQSFKERLKVKAHPEKTYQIVYTTDGSRIISCGNNPVIRVFDTQMGKLAYTLEGHQRSVQSLILSDDGTTLISTSDDHTVRLWAVTDRTETMAIATGGEILSAIYKRERDLLIVGDTAGELTTIDTRRSRKTSSVKQLDKISSIAVHPDGNLLAAGDGSGQIRLRNLSREGTLLEGQRQSWQAHQGDVSALVWSIDGSRLVSTGNDGQIVSWNIADLESAEPIDIRSETSGTFCLRPNSSSLLVPCKDLSTGTLISRLDWKLGKWIGHSDNPVFDMPSAKSDGRFFAAIYHKDLARTYDELYLFAFPADAESSLTSKRIATWMPQQGELRNIRFSPDSKFIAVSKWYKKSAEEIEDHTVWLVSLSQLDWTVTTNSERVPSQIEMAERIPVLFARDSQFSPDSKRLALVTQTHLVLWDIGKKEIVWQRPNSTIQELAYSPDGSFIAICGGNRMVQVLNASDGSIRFQSTNHRAHVETIACSPDSRLLATGAQDGTIKFWHVASGQELLELHNPGDNVKHIEFSEDGERLICQIARPGKEDSYKFLVYDGSQFDP